MCRRSIVVVMAWAISLLAIGTAGAADRTVTFTLTWTDNSDNESGFIAYQKNSAGSYVEVGRVGTNVTKFVAPPVTGPEGSTWCYAVSAFNSAGESAKSNDACATIPFLVPNPPGGLTITLTVQ